METHERRMVSILPLGLLALVLTGCEDVLYDAPAVTYATSDGYVQEPPQQEQASQPMNTEQYADFPIPKENPHGDLRVTSYGLIDVGAKDKPDQRIAAIHMHMALTNNSDQAWTVDTREQRISIAGHGTSVVAFVSKRVLR